MVCSQNSCFVFLSVLLNFCCLKTAKGQLGYSSSIFVLVCVALCIWKKLKNIESKIPIPLIMYKYLVTILTSHQGVQQGSQISHYFLCISLSQKSKFHSKWLNFPAMTLPNFPPFFHHASHLVKSFCKQVKLTITAFHLVHHRSSDTCVWGSVVPLVTPSDLLQFLSSMHWKY